MRTLQNLSNKQIVAGSLSIVGILAVDHMLLMGVRDTVEVGLWSFISTTLSLLV